MGLATAQAQDPRSDQAREHFARGQTAYNQGDYEAAIREWNSAYELDARPRIQFNLAQAYERLGRLTEALTALDNYIEAADPNDAQQADARSRRGAIRQRLDRTGVRITGAPDGALITIDDQDWGRAPRPDTIRLEPGSHRVRIKLDGYSDFTAVVSVPAGQEVEVAVEMSEATAPVAGPAGATESSSGGSILPYVVIGAGGALFVGGLLIGTAAVGQAKDAPSKDSTEADDARSLAAVADLTMVVGLVGAGVGVVLMLLDGGSDSSERVAGSVRVTPVAGPTAWGASAAVTFE